MNSTLGDFSPTSTGATAFVPNARANEVSSVANLRVVRRPITPRGGILPIFPLDFPI